MQYNLNNDNTILKNPYNMEEQRIDYNCNALNFADIIKARAGLVTPTTQRPPMQGLTNLNSLFKNKAHSNIDENNSINKFLFTYFLKTQFEKEVLSKKVSELIPNQESV